MNKEVTIKQIVDCYEPEFQCEGQKEQLIGDLETYGDDIYDSILEIVEKEKKDKRGKYFDKRHSEYFEALYTIIDLIKAKREE